MAIERLPEHLKSGRTAEAIMAPGSILAGGAGAAAAILLGAPIAAAVGLGAVVYGALVAFRLPRKKRPPGAIDPMSLSEPWRRFADDAQDAQRSFHDVVGRADAGPIRERLTEIATRVDAAAMEAGRIAQRGHTLDNGIARLNMGRIESEFQTVMQEEPDHDSPSHESWAATVQAIQAQRDSGGRLVTVAQDARNRLRVLNARLDEMVARAVELSLQTGDTGGLEALDGDVASLVDEMEALRGGLEEVGRVARGSS